MNLAHLMQKNLREALDNENKRVAKAARDSFIILREPPDIPAIIIECGFLSNANEASKLKEDNYQQKIAECIANTVNIYFKE
jgi:N-acetylmuramoyl-L-alanine amidase